MQELARWLLDPSRLLAALPQCHTFTGTVTYMSPERISSQPYSFPADIWWALGWLLALARGWGWHRAGLAQPGLIHALLPAGAWGWRCWSAPPASTPTRQQRGRCSSWCT